MIRLDPRIIVLIQNALVVWTLIIEGREINAEHFPRVEGGIR